MRETRQKAAFVIQIEMRAGRSCHASPYFFVWGHVVYVLTPNRFLGGEWSYGQRCLHRKLDSRLPLLFKTVESVLS